MVENKNLGVRLDVILPSLKIMSVGQALRIFAAELAAARANFDEQCVYRQLSADKDVIASGIGGGVALPHMMMPELTQPFSIFARLERAIEYPSVDDQPVDLICLLLSPENEARAHHLRRLARLSRLLRDAHFCHRIKGIHTEDGIRALVMYPHTTPMAA